ncbi:MAG: hemerythrin family protein [Nitrospirae bacterium]|nr:hemerythrin family protein [Nitrospirota bacterium]
MEWDENLSVGVESMDSDHKELFKKIKELVYAINQHTCKYKIDDVIKFLEDYAKNHFAMEENFMKECGYPEYRQHKAEHRKFIATFSELKSELLKIKASGKYDGSYELSVTTDQVLVDWLLDHIAKVDRKLAKFLNDRVRKTNRLTSL